MRLCQNSSLVTECLWLSINKSIIMYLLGWHVCVLYMIWLLTKIIDAGSQIYWQLHAFVNTLDLMGWKKCISTTIIWTCTYWELTLCKNFEALLAKLKVAILSLAVVFYSSVDDLCRIWELSRSIGKHTGNDCITVFRRHC